MADIKVTVEYGDIDFDKLNTESDFKHETKRILPQVMKQFAEATAEELWKQLKKEFGTSNSEKPKFIRETRSSIEKDMSQKRQVEKGIIADLKEQKKKHDKNK